MVMITNLVDMAISLAASVGPAAQSSLWNSASTMQTAVQLGLENRPMAWAVTLSTPGGRRTSGFLLSPHLNLTDHKITDAKSHV